MRLTEADWQGTTTRPVGMLQKLRGIHGRKPQLAACAIARLVWDRLPQKIQELLARIEHNGPVLDVSELSSERAVWEKEFGFIGIYLSRTEDGFLLRDLVSLVTQHADNRRHFRREVCEILREIYGNPFQPRQPVAGWLGGGWLQPDGKRVLVPSTARGIAEAIRDDLDFSRLPVLADALEESGCTDFALLEHCRRPTGHIRGCWALDLVAPAEES